MDQFSNTDILKAVKENKAKRLDFMYKKDISTFSYQTQIDIYQLALKSGSLKVVQWLLNELDFSFFDCDQEPSNIAARNGHVDCLWFITTNGAAWSDFTLGLSSYHNHQKCFKTLVKNNNFHYCDTAISYVVHHRNLEGLKFLMEHVFKIETELAEIVTKLDQIDNPDEKLLLEMKKYNLEKKIPMGKPYFEDARGFTTESLELHKMYLPEIGENLELLGNLVHRSFLYKPVNNERDCKFWKQVDEMMTDKYLQTQFCKYVYEEKMKEKKVNLLDASLKKVGIDIGILAPANREMGKLYTVIRSVKNILLNILIKEMNYRTK